GSPCSLGGFGGQLGGLLEEGGGGGQPAAVACSARHALHLAGDLLVDAEHRPRAVPGEPVGITGGVGGGGQRTVRTTTVGGGGDAVHGRARERVAEPHPAVDLQQPGRLRRRGGVDRDAQ